MRSTGVSHLKELINVFEGQASRVQAVHMRHDEADYIIKDL